MTLSSSSSREFVPPFHAGCVEQEERATPKMHMPSGPAVFAFIKGKVPSGFLFVLYILRSQQYTGRHQCVLTSCTSRAQEANTHTALVHSRGNSGPVQSSDLNICLPQAWLDLSSVVGLTMPQSSQLSLIRVLLLWTTILSIVQAVFIILFFTAGHLGQVRPA